MKNITLASISGGWLFQAYVGRGSQPAITGTLEVAQRTLSGTARPALASINWCALGSVPTLIAGEFAAAISQIQGMLDRAEAFFTTDQVSVTARRIFRGSRSLARITVTCGTLRAIFDAGILGNKVEYVNNEGMVDIPLYEDTETEVAPGLLLSDPLGQLWYEWAKQAAKVRLKMASPSQIVALAEDRDADWTRKI